MLSSEPSGWIKIQLVASETCFSKKSSTNSSFLLKLVGASLPVWGTSEPVSYIHSDHREHTWHFTSQTVIHVQCLGWNLFLIKPPSVVKENCYSFDKFPSQLWHRYVRGPHPSYICATHPLSHKTSFDIGKHMAQHICSGQHIKSYLDKKHSYACNHPNIWSTHSKTAMSLYLVYSWCFTSPILSASIFVCLTFLI